VELENDEDDIHSIAGSEWTVNTSCTNGGGILSMETIKDKMAILGVGDHRLMREKSNE
jgi:hypothetical protein